MMLSDPLATDQVVLVVRAGGFLVAWLGAF
jgi:hypothetical protein